MCHSQLSKALLLAIMLSCTTLALARGIEEEEERSSVKTSVFQSPPFYLNHGSVRDKFYYDIPFPRGHIALKSFVGEVVDEDGNPVPLHETYLHHWVVDRYYGEKGSTDDATNPNTIVVRNSGPCKVGIEQYFGLGSETRKTDTWIPDPYGIEVGVPSQIPEGYEERWMLNVHAIDTRGVDDKLGCMECKRSLYNVTLDRYGLPLEKQYPGGLRCCYDHTQCGLEGGVGTLRKLFFRYTIKWMHWNPSIIPVKIYIIDVTAAPQRPASALSRRIVRDCEIEYTVQPCRAAGKADAECVDVKKTRVLFPQGGDVIYGVAHQHTGAVGSALYGEDGRLLCNSVPMYGKGKEAGDEAGYIVGMSTCYPKPGTVVIKDGELLSMVSNYSNERMHIGVMGLFYLLVAERRLWPKPILSTGLSILGESWWVLVFAGLLLYAVAALIRRRREDAEGYMTVSSDSA